MEPTPLENRVKPELSDFFRDSRGQFSIFTIVALLASLALIYTCVNEAYHTHIVQTELIWGFIFMYCVNTLSDSLLAAVIARGYPPAAPSTQITADVKTDELNVPGPERAKVD